MTQYRLCTWLVVGLLGVPAVALAQLTNPPPAKALSGYGSFELLPVELDRAEAAQKGKDKAASKIQEQVEALVAPVVAEWNKKPPPDGAPRLVIAPRIDVIKKVGGASRFWVGAMAGDSYVTMHVRLTEQPGDVAIADAMFYQRASAMSGAWTVGAQDNDMLRRVAQLIADYLRANYDSAVGGPTGQPK
jgi:hypothetical protein